MGEAATRSHEWSGVQVGSLGFLSALEIGAAFIDAVSRRPRSLALLWGGQSWTRNFCTSNCPFQAMSSDRGH
jgi:hypothetical protein